MYSGRQPLAQLDGGFFLTDGGLETTLIFHQRINLPEFASFVLLNNPEGLTTLGQYFRGYAELAHRYHAGMILESATWRANADWGSKLGYDHKELVRANHQAIDLLVAVRDEFKNTRWPMIISGNIGPRGDGYRPDLVMTPIEARDYHQQQVDVFSGTPADLVSAFTMNYVEEALGIVWAAQRAHMPVVISFTVETDGRLATGQPLPSAIEQVDRESDNYPSYYMINCAHPTHFFQVLHESAQWKDRVRGIRANSSTKSHAELNDSTELDVGNPVELGNDHLLLKQNLPRLNVFGGCCGTDLRHVEEIAKCCRQ